MQNALENELQHATHKSEASERKLRTAEEGIATLKKELEKSTSKLSVLQVWYTSYALLLINIIYFKNSPSRVNLIRLERRRGVPR